MVLHGGPGSGAGTWWRAHFDFDRYHVITFDQRGCGGSRPLASDDDADLSTNTTGHVIGDIERLRRLFGIESWLVLGGSWGSTLGLAYAQQHPDRVSELVLFSVVTTTGREVQWVTRDMGRVFPRQWARFVGAVPAHLRDGDLAYAYSVLLHDPDPRVRFDAAKAWCEWEDTHVGVTGFVHDRRFDDPVFRLGFARLVTHYWSHAAWLGETELRDGMDRVGGIPGALVTGTADVSAPADIAWGLAQRWPRARLHIVDGAGHGAGEASISAIVRDTIDGFGSRW